MHVIAEHGSTRALPDHREILLNFCRVVLRSDDVHLQEAIEDYRRSLFEATVRGNKPPVAALR